MKPVAALVSIGLLAVALASTAFAAESAAGSTSAATAKPSPEPAAAIKPDLVKGEATSKNVCGACHANDGSRGSPTYPILEGQHPEYLVKQLSEYKAGKRVNAIMNGMAATLSETDMKNVAAFYSAKEAKPGFAKSRELATLGEKIYRGGIAERSIPACAGCHSPNGAGLPIQYPRLAGQHEDYTATQLVAFRGGVRKNSVPMTGIAAKLNDREIQALADYIAGLH